MTLRDISHGPQFILRLSIQQQACHVCFRHEEYHWIKHQKQERVDYVYVGRSSPRLIPPCRRARYRRLPLGRRARCCRLPPCRRARYRRLRLENEVLNIQHWTFAHFVSISVQLETCVSSFNLMEKQHDSKLLQCHHNIKKCVLFHFHVNAKCYSY